MLLLRALRLIATASLLLTALLAAMPDAAVWWDLAAIVSAFGIATAMDRLLTAVDAKNE